MNLCLDRVSICAQKQRKSGENAFMSAHERDLPPQWLRLRTGSATSDGIKFTDSSHFYHSSCLSYTLLHLN